MRVLVIAEHENGALSAATSKTLSCAAAIGAETDVAVFASDGRSVAEEVAQLEGVARVLLIDDALHANALAALIAPQVAELAAGYSHVIGPASTFGRDLMPRIAALLGTVQVSDVMAVDTPTQFRRPLYAGNAIATVEVPAQPIVATVRLASFRPVPQTAQAAPIEVIRPEAPLPSHTRFVERLVASGDRPDLQTASRVVSGGRAFGSAENFRQLEELADVLGAAVGASRAAVDSGFAPNELQVGQTGKIIAPALYFAIGISGAIQHLTGIKDAGTIVAINRDPDAPIFEVADIGLVGDLFTILPELIGDLKKATAR